MELSFLEKFVSFVRSHRPAMASSLENGLLSAVMVSSETVKLSRSDLAFIDHAAAGFEALKNLPSYQKLTHAHFPQGHIAHFDPGYGTIFDCLDFHITPAGPRLIEFNTNASGSLLSTLLREFHGFQHDAHWSNPMAQFKRMLELEWAAYTEVIQKPGLPLKTIAIVDSKPQEQRTYFEFKMFQELFQQWGLSATISDPSEIQLLSGRVTANGQPIDLIYNRLTDFYLEDPAHAILKKAYLERVVCLTPHPYGYGLMADKGRLTSWGQKQVVDSLGLPAQALDSIRSVTLKTVVLTKENSKHLWEERRRLFFKPQRSYGGKSAYRGSSISRAPFERLIDEQAIAQEFAEPGKTGEFKYDLRVYIHRGKVLLVGARLFQGQLMNFKTLGGGFGAVQVYP